MTVRDVLITGNDCEIALGPRSDVDIYDSVLSGNGTAVAGGMQSGPNVYRSIIRDNTTGIATWDELIEDSVIRDNGPGGGVSVTQGLFAQRSKILDDRSKREGGGVSGPDRPSPTADIEDTLIRGNQSTRKGGRMWARCSTSGGASECTLRNVTFEDNTGGQDGGGLYVEGEPPTLTNVTFKGSTPNDCVGC